jgi:hypothetical protein
MVAPFAQLNEYLAGPNASIKLDVAQLGLERAEGGVHLVQTFRRPVEIRVHLALHGNFLLEFEVLFKGARAASC